MYNVLFHPKTEYIKKNWDKAYCKSLLVRIYVYKQNNNSSTNKRDVKTNL